MLQFYFTIFVLSFCAVSLPSCTKNDDGCTASEECNTSIIDSGDVKVRISYKSGQPGIPVILYKGYVEDKEIVWQDTVFQSEIFIYMPVGERYAAEAYYQTSGKTVVALDGKKLKNDTYRECGTKCYDFPTISLDCRSFLVKRN